MLKYKNKQYTKGMYCDQAGESQAWLLLENALVDCHIRRSNVDSRGLAFSESAEMTICTDEVRALKKPKKM